MLQLGIPLLRCSQYTAGKATLTKLVEEVSLGLNPVEGTERGQILALLGVLAAARTAHAQVTLHAALPCHQGPQVAKEREHTLKAARQSDYGKGSQRLQLVLEVLWP